MTRHQFGSIVGDEDTGGIVNPGRACLLHEWGTVAVAPHTITPAGVRRQPIGLALRLAGPVNRTVDVRDVEPDELDAVFLIDPLDAGRLAGAILDGVLRAGGKPLLEKALDLAIAGIGGADPDPAGGD